MPANTRLSSAFTLVEIMIVVVIIGLLAALAIPAFKRVQRATQNNRVANDLRVFSQAFEQYTLEKGTWPPNSGNGVVHFHSFRKTMQSLGVRCGINQRAAQEILGHADANLTAQAYTDVASLELHDEIAKLPWISSSGIVAQHGAQNSGVSRPALSRADICAQLVEAVKVSRAEGVGHALASAVTPSHFDEMAARAGIEPATK